MTDETINNGELGEEDEVFSLDDLDKMLEETDPEFAESMQQMKNDKDLQAAEVADLATDELETPADSEPRKYVKLLRKPLSILRRKVVMPLRNVGNATMGRALWTKAWIRRQLRSLKQFFVTGFPERIKFFRSQIRAKSKKSWLWFKGLPVFKKILVISATPFLAGVVFLGVYVINSGRLPMLEPPLVGNLAEHAERVVAFDPATDMVSYYRSFRQQEFTVQLKRIVVNIRPSERSSSLPMAAFRLYLATSTQQTAIEIKDREHEFIDLISRTTEDMNYDELVGARGKETLKGRIIEALNQRLNVGQVTAVYMETIILKP